MRGGLRGLALAPATRSFATVAGPDLDLTSGGTFARGSEGSYLTAAPNTAGSFLAYATSGTRRSAENRGDGLGVGYLSEKAATNYLPTNQAISSGDWTNTTDVTTNQHAGPDGLTLADRVNHASAAFGPRPSDAGGGPAGQVCISQWIRAVSGTGTNQINLFHNSGGAGLARIVSSTSTTYSRVDGTGNATANSGAHLSDGRDLSSSGGTTAHAEDHYIDLPQLESSYYPTSAIRNSGSGTATRAADTLSYASGSFPAAFLTSGGVFTFAPDASNVELWSSVEEWRFVQYGGADCVRLVKNSSSITNELRLQLVIADTVVAQITTVTFSRGQALTITWKPSAGSITLSGATTGDGTASGSGAAWAGFGTGVHSFVSGTVPPADTAPTGNTLYVGGDSGGTSNVTGRYLDARGLGTIPCIQVAP